MSEAAERDEDRAGRRCPICGRPTEHRWRPFCSKRCADVDLSRWLRGAYAVPVVDPDKEDEAGPGEVVRLPGRDTDESGQER